MDLKNKSEESQELSGLKHECGVFACIGSRSWARPNQNDVAQVICLGLVALQHSFRVAHKQLRKVNELKKLYNKL
ncbi:hypothetical protein J6590_011859 [Homalodisca vitripennis]|nr:hypothetical protein J6590_011859 [Homalodisca vitripennis]